MLNEIWKPVPNFPNYEVSSLGRVRNVHTGKLRKLYKGTTCKGYWNVGLYKDNKLYAKLVHRLVAEAFIPNPLDKKYVNHKDTDRENNSVENLEWVTASENIQHAMKFGNMNFSAVKGVKRANAQSKYHNVCYRSDKKRWVTTTKVNGKRLSQRLFKTEEEAGKWADELLRMYNITDRPFNFP